MSAKGRRRRDPTSGSGSGTGRMPGTGADSRRVSREGYCQRVQGGLLQSITLKIHGDEGPLSSRLVHSSIPLVPLAPLNDSHVGRLRASASNQTVPCLCFTPSTSSAAPDERTSSHDGGDDTTTCSALTSHVRRHHHHRIASGPGHKNRRRTTTRKTVTSI